MIFRTLAQALLLVGFVATLSYFVGPGVIDEAVHHVIGGLEELANLGHKLATNGTADKIGRLLRQAAD